MNLGNNIELEKPYWGDKGLYIMEYIEERDYAHLDLKYVENMVREEYWYLIYKIGKTE